MESRENVLETLKTLRYLVDRDREWIGYINLNTGVIAGLTEGEETRIRLGSPEEVKTKGMEGWTLFHSHLKKSPQDDRWDIKPGPSDLDRLIANINGLPNYLIDAIGIWEIKAIAPVPLETIKQAWLEAKSDYPNFIFEKLTRRFPTDVSLLYQWPE